jgi:hypothetical protein
MNKQKLSEYLETTTHGDIARVSTPEGDVIQISVEAFSSIIDSVEGLETENKLFWEKFQ